MNGEHRFHVHSEWAGNRGTGTSGYRDYDRAVTLSVDGKPTLEASAARVFHGERTKWNPEDLLLAALSECHLLSYLHACVKADVVVTAYEDDIEGTLRLDGSGGGAFTEAVLRPRVRVAEAAMVEAAVQAHQRAHEWCFIAGSVNFPVRVEPSVTADGA